MRAKVAPLVAASVSRAVCAWKSTSLGEPKPTLESCWNSSRWCELSDLKLSTALCKVSAACVPKLKRSSAAAASSQRANNSQPFDSVKKAEKTNVALAFMCCCCFGTTSDSTVRARLGQRHSR